MNTLVSPYVSENYIASVVLCAGELRNNIMMYYVKMSSFKLRDAKRVSVESDLNNYDVHRHVPTTFSSQLSGKIHTGRK